MTHRTLSIILLLICLVAKPACGQVASTIPPKSQPNLLFIFADDQAFNTIHQLGNDEIQTPNLDRLVRRGVTFTHAYNQGAWGGAVCVASRAMLNTGRFLWHAHQVYGSVDKDFRQRGRMWSQILAKGGYETYFSGKWHVRAKAELTFGTARHVRGGMPKQTPAGYNRPVRGKEDQWRPWATKFGGFWEGGKHWSEVLGDDAIDYLNTASKSDKPFFMYLAFNAPHDPRQSPKSFVERYPLSDIAIPKSFVPDHPLDIGSNRIRDERLAPFPRTEYSVKVNRQEYYAIITHMDQQIGRILKALKASGKANNTYIIFTADHGLACGHHGLMGKQNMYDHSIRVPLMIVGPGIQAGRKIDTPVYLQDVMPTTLDLAGQAKPDHIEFKSLMPIIRNQVKSNYRSVYGAYTKTQRMVIKDGFKLIIYPKINKHLLFNLTQDPEEMHDLASEPKMQERKSQLLKELMRLQKRTGDTLKVSL